MKLKIDSTLSYNGLIKAGNYDIVNFASASSYCWLAYHEINKGFEDFFKNEDEEIEIELIDVEGASLNKLEIPEGYRAPSMVEILSFGKEYPKEQEQGTIFSKTWLRDGDNSQSGVALRIYEGRRYLTRASWFCEKIPAGSRMLVVKQQG